jgi:hypothetical protein
LFRRPQGFRRIFSRFDKLDVALLAFFYLVFIIEGLRYLASVNTTIDRFLRRSISISIRGGSYPLRTNATPECWQRLHGFDAREAEYSVNRLGCYS